MQIKIISFLFVLFFTTNLFSQITEKDITLNTKTGNIEGTLLYPTSTKKIPLAIIIAGSGPTDRNGNNPMMTNNSLKMLAEALAKNNIATLRYDKRGVAESKAAGPKEQDLSIEHYIQDVKDWLGLLKKDKRFSELIIIGHSEGSLIGMIASKDKKVSKFISLAGVGVPAGEIIYNQIKTQAPMLAEPTKTVIEQLEMGEKADSIPPLLYSIFRPSVQPYLISWFKYDPVEEISTLNIPILIVQGTTDIQVNVSNAKLLAEANDNATLKIIEGMNHILKHAEADRQKNLKSYSDADLPLADGLVLIIADFINKQ